MKCFNRWKPTTFIGSIILGTGYGWIVANDKLTQWSDIEITVTILCGTALFACVTWAFWRYFEAWQMIRQTYEPAVSYVQPEDLTYYESAARETLTHQQNDRSVF